MSLDADVTVTDTDTFMANVDIFIAAMSQRQGDFTDNLACLQHGGDLAASFDSRGEELLPMDRFLAEKSSQQYATLFNRPDVGSLSTSKICTCENIVRENISQLRTNRKDERGKAAGQNEEIL
jgi:hypothetical protein